VDDHSGGFVYHDEVLVLIEKFERQVFRLGYGRGAGKDFDFHGFAGGDSVRGFCGAAVDADSAFADELLDARAAEVGHALGEEQV
jgi:hypothetical protein